MISLGTQAVVVAAIGIGVPREIIFHHGVERGWAFASRIREWAWPVKRCAACDNPSPLGLCCSPACKALWDGEHLEDETCWCQPALTYRDPHTGSKVWTHREWQ